ncbi:MAG: hypothetical protein J6S24_06160, partial [Lentisphaeria bacterium]|nr:hypothetical protein [Lentisphaeria bacterium]
VPDGTYRIAPFPSSVVLRLYAALSPFVWFGWGIFFVCASRVFFALSRGSLVCASRAFFCFVAGQPCLCFARFFLRCRGAASLALRARSQRAAWAVLLAQNCAGGYVCASRFFFYVSLCFAKLGIEGTTLL